MDSISVLIVDDHGVVRQGLQTFLDLMDDIEVIGHTDRSGDDEFNMALSRRRAERVRDLLVAAGIAPAAIRVAFHGEGNPLIQTSDNVHEPLNRRVEVIVR